MTPVRWVLIAVLAGVAAGCGTSGPSAAGSVGATPGATPTPPSAQVSASGSPSGNPATPSGSSCSVDMTVSGAVQGQVTGQQNGTGRPADSVGDGASIDTFFALPDSGPQALFEFKIVDIGGPAAANALSASLGRSDTGASGTWRAGHDPGTATLAPDGSSAMFDLVIPAVAFAKPVHLVGTIACPIAAPSA